MVWNRLNAGDVCLYGTISRTREEVIRDLGTKGWDASPYIRTGTLRIVDYLASAETASGTPEERLKTLLSMSADVLRPESFYQVFLEEFTNAKRRHPDKRFFAIFDSIDRMMAAMGPESTLRFAEMSFKELRGTNSIGVALLCNETTSTEILEVVRTTASVFIELKRERKEKEVSRMLRITKPGRALAARWAPWYY